MVYDRVEHENTLAILFTIAGQSLLKLRTLSNHRRQRQLETVFTATSHYLLDEWNAGRSYEKVDHPQTLLKKWLGFRLNPGQNIEIFFFVCMRTYQREK